MMPEVKSEYRQNEVGWSPNALRKGNEHWPIMYILKLLLHRVSEHEGSYSPYCGKSYLQSYGPSQDRY